MKLKSLSWQDILIALSIAVLLWMIISAADANSQPSALQPVPDPVGNAMVCPPRGLTLDASIVRVIDGDTVVCESRFVYHVRLLDCWAPESRTKDPDEKQRGLASKARLVEIADQQPVRLHIPAGRSLADVITFDRVLGYVWLTHDGTPELVSINERMVADGFATQEKL